MIPGDIFSAHPVAGMSSHTEYVIFGLSSGLLIPIPSCPLTIQGMALEVISPRVCLVTLVAAKHPPCGDACRSERGIPLTVDQVETKILEWAGVDGPCMVMPIPLSTLLNH